MSAVPEGKKHPTAAQRAWLRRGLDQPGGKLPLFDTDGGKIDPRTIRACIERGWAAPWFDNPLKPDWLVCKLTAAGRVAADPAAEELIQRTKNASQATILEFKNRHT
jgi:hypothetical protein